MVHAVVDTKGSGRLVGIFEDEARARRILAIDPAYFRVISMPLNTVNPVAVDWLYAKDRREELRMA